MPDDCLSFFFMPGFRLLQSYALLRYLSFSPYEGAAAHAEVFRRFRPIYWFRRRHAEEVCRLYFMMMPIFFFR